MNLSVLAWTPYVVAVTLLGSPSPDRRCCAPMAEREWQAILQREREREREREC